jgi:hypothetical protein
MHARPVLVLSAALFFTAGAALDRAQTLPTTQPGLIEIYMEDIKLGHGEAHEANEAGWVGAFERAEHPYPYLALESVTGRSQVWYTAAYENHAAIGTSMRLIGDNKVLASELARFARLDAEHVENVRIVHARARADLSHGNFPDIATQRFWEITTMRLRPGFEEAFAAAAKAYGTSASRNAPNANYRIYEVLAGMPSPTYFIFGSTADFGELDAMLAGGDKTMQGLNEQEQEAMGKLGPGLVSMETPAVQTESEDELRAGRDAREGPQVLDDADARVASRTPSLKERVRTAAIARSRPSCLPSVTGARRYAEARAAPATPSTRPRSAPESRTARRRPRSACRSPWR